MNNLFVYVEGNDDKRFIDEILSKHVDLTVNVIVIPYQQASNKKIANHIKMLKSKNYPFIFLTDLDSLYYPCITKRKEKRISEYNSLDYSDIIVVCEEIESWFLAGIDKSQNLFNGFYVGENTEQVSKETFEKMLKNSEFDSKIDFIHELSKNYDFHLAFKRNSSLNYFFNRLQNLGFVNI